MRVPYEGLPTVAPNGVPFDYQTEQANPSDFGAQAGDALQRTAQVGAQAAEQLANHAVVFQEIDNETAAKDADAKFTRQLTDLQFDPQKGYYTLRGKNAVDGYAAAQDQVQQLRQDALDALPNQRARNMFDTIAQRRMAMAMDGMARHAAQQRQVYIAQASDARVDATLNAAAASYNDDKQFQLALNTAKQEAVDTGQLNGWAPEVVNAQIQKYTDKAWSLRLGRMALTDPVGAQDLYRQNIGAISGTAQAQIEHSLKGAVDAVQTRQIATRIMAGQATPNEQLADVVESQESGGNQAAVSGKGAVGVMQLMPDTAKQVAAELGVPFDPDRLANDADYNRALGRQYLNDMLQRYGGNQTLAVAAYNAGPANVDKWVATIGDPRTGAISDADFAAKIPFPETQQYVEAINAKAPPSAGTPPTSQDVNAHLGAWLGAADSMPGLDPLQRDMVKSRILTNAHQIETAQEAQQRQNRDTLFAAALGTNGQKPTTLDQLLASPQTKEAFLNASPEVQRGAMELVDHNARNTEPPVSADSERLFYQWSGLAHTDPVAFANADLSQLISTLPHSQLAELMAEQGRLQSQQGRDATKGTNLEHALTVTRPMLMAAGIAAHITDKSPQPEKDTFNQYVGRLSAGLDQFTNQNKRTPNDKEIMDIGRALLVEGAHVGTAGHWPWSSDDKVRAFQVDPKEFYVPVPTTEKPKIAGAFQKVFGRAPSDGEIQDWYTKSLTAGSK